jgi:hypothetical protein
LEDGRTIAAADGADEIKPSADGKSVIAVWRRWVVVGANTGVLIDPGLVSEVKWALEGNTLRRKETLTASKTLNVRRLWLAVPSRYDRLETSYLEGVRTDQLISEGKTLAVQVKESSWPLEISIYATGNAPLGRGDRGPLPIHLTIQTKTFTLVPATPAQWELSLTAH